MSNYRINPPISSSRYFHLIRLRNKTLSYLKDYIDPKKKNILLDFGCGDMPYKELISPMVNFYLGVDLKINPIADHHIDFNSKTTLPDEHADIILSNQVLEHVDSPESYLQEAHRLLKKDGFILLSTHGYWFYHPTPFDYWRWTSAGLRKTIEKEGFEIVRFEGIMGLTASGLQLTQDGLMHKMPGFLRPVFSFIMQRLIFLFDKVHSQEQRNKDASLYILIARKI